MLRALQTSRMAFSYLLFPRARTNRFSELLRIDTTEVAMTIIASTNFFNFTFTNIIINRSNEPSYYLKNISIPPWPKETTTTVSKTGEKTCLAQSPS